MFAGSVKCEIEDKDELNKRLQKEIIEARYHLKNMIGNYVLLSNAINDDKQDSTQASKFRIDNALYLLANIAMKTSEENLNEMKSEAILSLKQSRLGFSVQCSEFDQQWVYSHDDIDDHSDNILKGEK
jgi:hypothetical protein